MENMVELLNHKFLIVFLLSLSKWLSVPESKFDQGPATADLLYQLLIGAQWASSTRAQLINILAQRVSLNQGSNPIILPREQRSTKAHNTQIITHIITVTQQSWWYPPGSIFYHFFKS